MIAVSVPQASWRLERADSTRLAWAFGISVAVHLLLWGAWYGGQRYGWWDKIRLPAWLQSHKMLTELLKSRPEPDKLREPEIPLVFVSVSDAQAVTEPPKDAKYYSDKNSRAANPEASQETDAPKITGNQDVVPKTEDVPRQEYVPLQPAIPAPPAPEPQKLAKAQPTDTPGDLNLGKPDTDPKKDDGQEKRPRPRTLQEARARRPDMQIPGPKMRQEGGVRRKLEFAALDAKATLFGAYDAALVAAISQRWFTLLDDRMFASDARGKVVLQFVLHYDGRVSEMKTAENTSGEIWGLICQKAVLDPAPFPTWPIELRRQAGDTRKIQFTFYYN